MREIVPEAKPTWAKDLRWQKVWGHIRPCDEARHEGRCLEIHLAVIFDGLECHSRIHMDKDLQRNTSWVLDECVRKLDEMLDREGFPPYHIRSV